MHTYQLFVLFLFFFIFLGRSGVFGEAFSHCFVLSLLVPYLSCRRACDVGVVKQQRRPLFSGWVVEGVRGLCICGVYTSKRAHVLNNSSGKCILFLDRAAASPVSECYFRVV